MSEDLDALLLRTEQEAFGRPWQIAQQGAGPWHTITGVFDRFHVEMLGEDGAPQSSRRVILSIDPADLPAGFDVLPGCQVRGIRIQAGVAQPTGELWQVAATEPDASGGLELTLSGRRGVARP